MFSREHLAQMIFGRSLKEAHAASVCIDCQEPAPAFTDAISKREYEISGLCQNCQDLFFGTQKGDAS